jgi:hypothetical protein
MKRHVGTGTSCIARWHRCDVRPRLARTMCMGTTQPTAQAPHPSRRYTPKSSIHKTSITQYIQAQPGETNQLALHNNVHGHNVSWRKRSCIREARSPQQCTRRSSTRAVLCLVYAQPSRRSQRPKRPQTEATSSHPPIGCCCCLGSIGLSVISTQCACR